MNNLPVFHCCQPGLLFDAVDRDAGVFLDLARLFVQETIARVDDIERASSSGAFSDMGYAAHSLKGTVGAVGASGLVQLLQDIEHSGLRHSRPCTEPQLARLRQLLEIARNDMHAYVAMIKRSL